MYSKNNLFTNKSICTIIDIIMIGGFTMTEEVAIMRQRAIEARIMYKTGEIAREEAKVIISLYLDEMNKKSLELAKKYNQKHKKVTFSSFVR